MGTRILGVAAAIAAFALNAILQLFDAQGWTMPDWLGVVLLVALILFGAIAVLIVLNELRKGAAWLFGQFHFRSPVVLRDAIDPNQWLHDLANEDAENPAQFLLITDTTITGLDLSTDLERPWIELGVTLFNCNVHTVTVGGASGHARFNGKELREPIIGSRGKSNMPRGHRQIYNMKQYLSPEQAAQIDAERREETRVCGGQRRKELRSLDLAGVAIEGECEGRVMPFPLGGVQRFHYD